MDPLTHTFTGAALADAGLRKATPLATAALVVAANVPDLDILTYVGGEYAALAHRRGWTHGLPAVAVWPFVVAGLLLAWDRWYRRMRRPGAAPARAGPLLAVSALGVLTHPALDWLNTYGMRWLMPFSGTWSYGDAVFIVDPWIWLCLGGALFLRHSRSRASGVGWAFVWGGGTLLVMTASPVPRLARVGWALWLGLLLVRRLGMRGSSRRSGPGVSRVALASAAIYVVLMVGADLRMSEAVRRQALDGGLDVRDVMVAPEPANPFRGSFLVVVPTGYEEGTVQNPLRPRPSFAGRRIPRVRFGPGVRRGAEVMEEARGIPRIRDFLRWSRYPFWEVERRADGHRVRVGDARYAGAPGAGSLRGVTVDIPDPTRTRGDPAEAPIPGSP